MNEVNNSPGCERGPDLIAFLYKEMDQREAHDFELHLKQCAHCREESASFGVVRESITAWRDEVLSGFVATPVPVIAPRKSALAAFRQFFDLSPLWLKGATAFAMVAFCVVAGIAFVNLQRNTGNVPSGNKNPDAIYTAQDVDRMVEEALARQESVKQPVEVPQHPTVTIEETQKPSKPRTPAPNQLVKSRRPLSRAEREQLAADLRLLADSDDETLQLIGDRINQ